MGSSCRRADSRNSRQRRAPHCVFDRIVVSFFNAPATTSRTPRDRDSTRHLRSRRAVSRRCHSAAPEAEQLRCLPESPPGASRAAACRSRRRGRGRRARPRRGGADGGDWQFARSGARRPRSGPAARVRRAGRGRGAAVHVLAGAAIGQDDVVTLFGRTVASACVRSAFQNPPDGLLPFHLLPRNNLLTDIQRSRLVVVEPRRVGGTPVRPRSRSRLDQTRRIRRVKQGRPIDDDARSARLWIRRSRGDEEAPAVGRSVW